MAKGFIISKIKINKRERWNSYMHKDPDTSHADGALIRKPISKPHPCTYGRNLRKCSTLTAYIVLVNKL